MGIIKSNPKIIKSSLRFFFKNFDLVVLGSKGHHSQLKEILLGTVSTNVVKSAPCDILIVK